MELIAILNRCHRFRGFVYQRARFSPDHKSIEVSVRPRKGSAAICSRCHQPAPGYDQLGERRFEFIPLWGFFVFLLYAMRRVDCRRIQALRNSNAEIEGLLSSLIQELRDDDGPESNPPSATTRAGLSRAQDMIWTNEMLDDLAERIASRLRTRNCG
jgi:hypothetical protein